MMKPLLIILSFLFATNAFAGYGGYIGAHDNRRYGSLSEPEYNGVVKLNVGGGRCTGIFVSKNIVLTNNHCVVACKNGCEAEFWNGSGYETSNLKVLAYNAKAKLSNGTDWGLLLSDKDSNFYKSIAPMSATGQVQRGGYGILRIIEDDEIPFLKDLYAKTKQEFKEECNKSPNIIGCFNRHIDKKLAKLGKKQLFKDGNNFKVQTCNIIGDSQKSNRIMQTDCDSSSGDSGAPLLRNNTIVGLNSDGLQTVFGDRKTNADAVKTENFYIPVQGFISKHANITDSWYEYVNDEKDEEMLGPVNSDLAQESSDTGFEAIQSMLQDLDCD